MQKSSLKKTTFFQYYVILITFLAISLLLSACGSTPDDLDDDTAGMSAEDIYNEAQDSMKSGNFDTAADLFEKLEIKYPYGPFAKQAKLEIIYAYFKFDNLESAIIAAERFIKLYPNHSHVDYAYYMQGVCRYNMEGSFFDSFFDQDITERDPAAASQAFNFFRLLLKKFPNSIYNEDARKRMIYLRNNLAKHEIHVANYYMKRRAYIAAVNRSKYILNNYQNTSSIKDALQIMIKAYTRLELIKLADDAKRVFNKNYPGKSG